MSIWKCGISWSGVCVCVLCSWGVYMSVGGVGSGGWGGECAWVCVCVGVWVFTGKTQKGTTPAGMYASFLIKHGLSSCSIFDF